MLDEELLKITKQYSVVFSGPVRNIEPYFDDVIRNIERIGSLFKSYYCVFVESDSSDNSKELLAKYAEGKNNVAAITMGNLQDNIPSRTVRIGIARNAAMEFCEQNNLFDTHEYFIQMCMDDVNAQDFDLNGILSCFKHDVGTWDAMTANQEEYYYDIWTLRCKDWVDYDCWEMVAKKPSYMSRQDAVNIYVVSRQLRLPKEYGLIEVDAAHGGLSIYKSSAVKGCRYGGIHPSQQLEESDIMQFCRMVKEKGGRIFINTEMINMLKQ